MASRLFSRQSLFFLSVIFTFCSLLFVPFSLQAETIVYGPVQFNSAQNKPATDTVQFAIAQTDGTYQLTLYNGSGDASELGQIDEGQVYLNNTLLIDAADFAQTSSTIIHPVSLQTENILSVTLNEPVGGFVVILIERLDNRAPVADAGEDQSVQTRATVTLDGSDSSDADGQSLSFNWALLQTPTDSVAVLDDASLSSPGFLADLPGEYIASLVVSDGLINSVPDSVTIQTESGNTSPVADAGTNQSARVGEAVMLDGSRSHDIDGDQLSYLWSIVGRPGGSISELDDAAIVNPAFIVDFPGDYGIELTVNDGEVGSVPDQIVISTDNTVPLANAGSDRFASAGDTVILDASASTDHDGDTLMYRWSLSAVPAGSQAKINLSQSVLASFIPDIAGRYVAQLIVNDGWFDSSADAVAINVDAANTRPVADAGADQRVSVGQTLLLDGNRSTDADGDAVNYSWSLIARPGDSVAELQDGTTAQVALTIDVEGEYIAQLMVDDGQEASAPDTVTFSTVNLRPVANAGADQIGVVNSTVNLSGLASVDADNDSLTYNWALISMPTNSSATLLDQATAEPQLFLDAIGFYVVQLVVSDGELHSAPDSLTLRAGPDSPLLISVEDPGNEAVTNDDIITVQGHLTHAAELRIDDVGVPLGNNLNFFWNWPLEEGFNSIDLQAVDALGEQFSLTLSVVKDSVPPGTVNAALLNSSGPDEDGLVLISGGPGSVDASAKVIIGNSRTGAQVQVTAGADGTFSVTIVAEHGDALTITVEDNAGNASASHQFTHIDPTANQSPEIQSFPVTQAKTFDTYVYSPNAVDADLDTLAWQLIQSPVNMQINSNTGQIIWLADISGLFFIELLVTDGKGGEDSQSFVIEVTDNIDASVSIPENPSNLATPMGNAPALPVGDATAFLYNTLDPIQKNLTPDTIEIHRASVIRGLVNNKVGAPLSGVRIEVKDHAEFGYTLTRADGRFDLAINAGESFTLNYSKAGHLSVQRQIDVPGQDYVRVEDVILIPLDQQISAIALDGTVNGIQVAQGSLSSDTAGERQTKLLFKPGTTASMILPDGGAQALNNLSVRSTEYSLDEGGPQAMPGALPIDSAYTFATELSIDEATAAGASRVDFSQPVSVYVDNFLNFAVGEDVPAAAYEKQSASWLAANDGRVIKILSISVGQANLDVDGDNLSDSGASLTDLGISDDERTELAALYSAGKTLWRVPVSHFTPWAFSWPWQLPEGAVAPPAVTPVLASAADTPERIAMPLDAETSLYYNSDRSLGYNANRTLDITLSEATLPQALKSIELTIRIAGQSYQQSFPPLPEQTFRYTWNSNDGYGRLVNGLYTASIDVNYVYDLNYQEAAAGFEQSFGQSSDGNFIGSHPVAHGKSNRHWSVSLGTHRNVSAGLEGFSVEMHHAYDAKHQMLYLGNGDQLVADNRLNPGQGIAADLSDSEVVSVDGSEIYAFDYQGRHLSTRDATNDQLLYTFAYDAEGLLASVTRYTSTGDEVTSITRDAAGKPLFITLPDGQIADFTYDTDGALIGISLGANGSYQFAMSPNGLISSFDDGSGNEPLVIPDNVLQLDAVTDTLPDPGNSQLVASIPGQFIVGADGTGTYSVPIVISPGTSGLEPGLSINYNSRAGNGNLGVGWSLAGLSSVHRCVQTYAQDGQRTGVDFNTNDRFCIDGQRLLAITGAYGANGTVYRTEMDNFNRVISYGNQGGGPQYFEVHTKSGETRQYGVSPNARVEAAGRSDQLVQHWALDKILDVKGNYLTVSYYENTSTGEHYPTRIDYTGNSAAGLTPFASVQLEYENRPDASFGYLAGSVISNNKRLKAVTSYAGNSIVRRYAFDYYAPDFVNKLSRLSQIRACVDQNENQCVAPTLIEWQKYSAGFETAQVNTFSNNLSSGVRDIARTIDFNGDGISDLMYAKDYNQPVFVDLYNSFGQVTAHLNTGQTMSTSPYWGGVVAIPMDYDGDGKTDLLFPNETTVPGVDCGAGVLNMRRLDNWTKVSYNNGTVSSSTVYINGSTGTLQKNTGGFKAPIVFDVNGDGLHDMLYPVKVGSGACIDLTRWLLLINKGPGPGPVNEFQVVNHGIHNDRDLRVIDMNGDGMQDIFSVNNELYLSTGDDFQTINLNWSNPDANIEVSHVIDINADGFQDLLWFDHNTIFYRLNKGGTNTTPGIGSFGPKVNALVTDQGGNSIGIDELDKARYVQPMDYNNDGLVDMMVPRAGTWWAYLAVHAPNNGGIRFEAHDTGVSQVGFKENPQFADFNGDGLTDIMYAYANRWNLTRHAGVKGGLVTRITAGRDRIDDKIELVHRPLTAPTVHVLNSTADTPVERDFQAPLYVVTQSLQDNGIGGQNSKRYFYNGAKINTRGRGLLGFAKQTVIDDAKGLYEVTDYQQNFPGIGLTTRQDVRRLSDARLLKRTEHDYENNWQGAVNNSPVFVYPEITTAQNYDLNTGVWISTQNTNRSYGDPYGNATWLQVKTTDNSGVYTQTTSNAYNNDTTNWHLGRLYAASVQHAGGQYGDTLVTRQSSFTYWDDGLLRCETIETAPQDLTTCYDYDAFGNKIRATVSGTGITSRATETHFDTQGRYAEYSENALNHRETYQHEPVLGNRTHLTGPNNLTTQWGHDVLGRAITETRADGTSTSNTYQWCGNGISCPTLATYKITTTTSGAPQTVAFYDQRDRIIETTEQSFNGSLIHNKTVYDARGRQTQSSRPYFTGNTPIFATVSYDDIDRKLQENSPVTGITSYAYNGLKVTVTNAKNQVTEETQNALGHTLSIKDPDLKTTTYQYDAAGNQTRIVDPLGNVIINEYNVRGEKERMIDPDMGLWRYFYNALGELTAQIDAKNQTLHLGYDLLGRMTSRYWSGHYANTLEEWDYDTQPKGIGKLAEESTANGFTRTYFYDNLGRAEHTETRIDGILYVDQLDYDVFSRPSVKTVGQISVNYQYNAYGYLERVYNPQQSGTSYWEGIATNADGLFTNQKQGDTTVLRHYNANTGRIETINSGNGQLQNLSYQFDTLGNLSQRNDLRQNRQETFGYDDLNRLTNINSNVSGSQTIVYDALGNIRQKDGLTYQYTNGRPHAVSQAGNISYSYDANGSMQSGDGRSLQWDHKNRLVGINDSQNNATMSFAYDGNGARFKQIRTSMVTTGPPPCPLNGNQISGQTISSGNSLNCDHNPSLSADNVTIASGGAACFSSPQITLQDGFTVQAGGQFTASTQSGLCQGTSQTTQQTATIHYAGDIERIAKNTGEISYRHYIRANGQTVATKITKNTAADETRILLRDHIGSVDTIVTQGGNLTERTSFGAWGDRRNPDWTTATSAINSIEPRGFTDHEHLDATGLIHMNGRVYDPDLGRFLSADPFIQFPKNLQSFNRYSYVLNNPLSYTDPSGYFANIIISIAVNLLATELGATVAWAIAAESAISVTALTVIEAAVTIGTSAVLTGVASEAMGGTFADGMEAGILNAVSAAASGYIGSQGFGETFGNTVIPGASGATVQRVIAHGLVGGISTDVNGGKFAHGFVSSAFSKSVSGKIREFTGGEPISGTMMAAVVGGTTSNLAGGKFTNGALTSSFGYMFSSIANGGNQESQYDENGVLKQEYWSTRSELLHENPLIAGAYWDRYMDHLDAYLINLGPYAGGLAGGLWPKSLVPRTGGRRPLLGSKNALTSVPRAVGVPGAGSAVVRTGSAAIGLATVAVGFYNVGVFGSGLVYAAFPGSNGVSSDFQEQEVQQ